MNVRQLISELEKYPGNAIVVREEKETEKFLPVHFGFTDFELYRAHLIHAPGMESEHDDEFYALGKVVELRKDFTVDEDGNDLRVEHETTKILSIGNL